MTRLLKSVAAIALLILPAEATAETDVQDMVYFGSTRPHLVRLHIRLDGRPYSEVHRAAWDAYITALVRQLDRNGDGVLSETEARLLPPPPRAAAGRPTNLAFNFRVVDADGDGKLKPSELSSYYREYGVAGLHVALPAQLNSAMIPERIGGGPTVATTQPAGAALFDRLDANKDGRLSQDELTAAEKVFASLDRDTDELLTAAELLPDAPVVNRQIVQTMARPTGGVAASNSPFVFPGQGTDNASLARRLRDRYGRSPEAREKGLSRDDLSLDADAFRRLDVDRDGVLNVAELERFTDRDADVELVLRLGRKEAGVRIEGLDGKDQPLRPSGAGTFLLTSGDAQIELRANDGGPAVLPDLRQQLVSQFQTADAARKGQLTADEAKAAGFFPGQFALLDRDGDGRLTEKELTAYLDEFQARQVDALTRSVSIVVSNEGRGLFDLLDRNRDGKLGLREIRRAGRLLAELGKEKEGLARNDMPRTYQLAVGPYQAGFDRAGGRGSFSPRGLPLLKLEWSRPGLVWFTKMDRNRDGDVSPREFLGRQEHFRRLDQDGDGLISAEEALRAEKKEP